MWAPLPTLFVNNFTPCIPFSQYFAGKIYILIKLKLHFCATFRPPCFVSVGCVKQPILINFFGFFLSKIPYVRVRVFRVPWTCLKYIYVMMCEYIINLFLIIMWTYGQPFRYRVRPSMNARTQKRRDFFAPQCRLYSSISSFVVLVRFSVPTFEMYSRSSILIPNLSLM